jgi:hypothetical protein
MRNTFRYVILLAVVL